MVKKQKEKISFSIGSGQQVGATESRQKTHWKLTFFDQTALSKAAINHVCFYLLLLMEAQKEWQKKSYFSLSWWRFYLKKQRHEKLQKMTIKLTFGLNKQSAVTVKHGKNFPQPAITIIKERRKKFVRETIDFFKFFVPLTVVMVNCCVPLLPTYRFRFCQLFHTPAYTCYQVP